MIVGLLPVIVHIILMLGVIVGKLYVMIALRKEVIPFLGCWIVQNKTIEIKYRHLRL